MPPDERPKISIPEASRRVGLSKQSIWRLARTGRIRGYRIGDHRILVDAEDVDQLVQPLPVETA